jgi:hypothetical protein
MGILISEARTTRQTLSARQPDETTTRKICPPHRQPGRHGTSAAGQEGSKVTSSALSNPNLPQQAKPVEQKQQGKPPSTPYSYGWNRNRNCLPLRSSRTVYKNRAIVSCSDRPALLKCLRTTRANWSLLTRSWPVTRRRVESGGDVELDVCMLLELLWFWL